MDIEMTHHFSKLGKQIFSHLHGVHDRDQIDEDAKVVSGEPLEIVGWICGHHFFVRRPSWCCYRLDGLLQLLQGRLDGLHLAQHQVVTDLQRKLNYKQGIYASVDKCFIFLLTFLCSRKHAKMLYFFVL